MAPLMNPCHRALVCSPAKTTRPAGRASHSRRRESNDGSKYAYPPCTHGFVLPDDGTARHQRTGHPKPRQPIEQTAFTLVSEEAADFG